MNLEITRNSADYEYGNTTFVVETASAHRGGTRSSPTPFRTWRN